MNAAKMREILHKDVVVVTFTKKNGEDRKMVCTLMPEFLPKLQEDTTASPAKSPASDTTITVWDLGKSAWRAFKVDSVKEFEYGD
jgi:hypothetical protein